MKKSLILGAASAVALAGAALAQSEPIEPTPQYVPETEIAVDVEASDVTTRDEAGKLASAEFLKADADVDGSIDEAEFTAWLDLVQRTNAEIALNAPIEEGDAAPLPTTEEVFAELAANGEAISEQQLIEAREASFDAADADGNAELDGEEQRIFAALVIPQTADIEPVEEPEL